jgi:hypothetical protein
MTTGRINQVAALNRSRRGCKQTAPTTDEHGLEGPKPLPARIQNKAGQSLNEQTSGRGTDLRATAPRDERTEEGPVSRIIT